MFTPENQSNTITVVKPTAETERKYPAHKQIIKAFETATKPYCRLNKIPAKDIWLRDFCPITDKNGKQCHFHYAPDYQSRKHSETVWKSIAPIFPHSTEININMDGGHFIYNGKGDFFISKKVLQLNTLTEQEITHRLISIGYNRVVWLPFDSTEKTGHLDGTMQFLDDNTLLTNNDIDKDTTLKHIFEETIYIISATCPDIKIIPIPTTYDTVSRYGWQSAVGIYTNFTQVQNALFLPTYGLQTDEPILRLFKQLTSKPVIPVRMEKIAVWGGSLHCITANQ